MRARVMLLCTHGNASRMYRPHVLTSAAPSHECVGGEPYRSRSTPGWRDSTSSWATPSQAPDSSRCECPSA